MLTLAAVATLFRRRDAVVTRLRSLHHTLLVLGHTTMRAVNGIYQRGIFLHSTNRSRMSSQNAASSASASASTPRSRISSNLLSRR